MLLVCAVGLTAAAATFGQPMYVNNIGVQVFGQDPVRAVMAATLVNQPNMLNILPLYIVLMMFWLPLVLWLIPRWPRATLMLSVAVWALANVLAAQPAEPPAPEGLGVQPASPGSSSSRSARLAAHTCPARSRPVSRAALLWPAVAYVAFAFLATAPWTQIAGLEGDRAVPREILRPRQDVPARPGGSTHVVALGYLA